MLQLLLNSHPATLKTGTSFKLTRVNPYFDDQGDYTLEVQLPLQGCPDNLAIFGPLHRPEMSHNALLGQRLKMQLIAPPITLEGYATITSITNTEVKVQLTAGKSALINAQGAETQYIDELPLGTVWDGNIWPSDPTALFGSVAETDAVIFPIYSEEDDLVVNALANDTRDPGLAYYTTTTTDTDHGEDHEVIITYHTDSTLIAPQPYLLHIIRHIITALGYTPGDLRAITDDPIRANIVILNTRCVFDRARVLPHWTVKEFFTEVQNLLGIVFTVEGGTVNARALPNYYDSTNAPVVLTKVVDTTQTDLDHNGNIETKVLGAATYKFPTDDPLLQLPEEVYKKATVLRLATIDDIRNHFSKLTTEQRAQSNYIYINQQNGNTYAILHRADAPSTYQLALVDQLAPFYTSEEARANPTELKIVPAHTLLANPSCWTGQRGGHESVRAYDPATDPHTAYPLLSVPTPVTDSSLPYSVDNAINPSDDTTDDSNDTTDIDTLHVAWYDGRRDACGKYNKAYFPEPFAITLYRNTTTGLYEDALQPHYYFLTSDTKAPVFAKGTPFALSTKGGDPHAGYGCIGDFLTGATNIDTRVEHQIQFLDAITPDPTATYLIRGRRYACHKLEITLTPTGPAPPHPRLLLRTTIEQPPPLHALFLTPSRSRLTNAPNAPTHQRVGAFILSFVPQPPITTFAHTYIYKSNPKHTQPHGSTLKVQR